MLCHGFMLDSFMFIYILFWVFFFFSFFTCFIMEYLSSLGLFDMYSFFVWTIVFLVMVIYGPVFILCTCTAYLCILSTLYQIDDILSN